MANVNYEGYGFDFGEVLTRVSPECAEAFNDWKYENDVFIEYYDKNYSDVLVQIPCNTDAFYAIFYIPTAYTVYRTEKREFRQFSVDEANTYLCDAVTAYLNSTSDWFEEGEDGQLDEKYMQEILAAIEPTIRERAGFDYEVGPWADYI